MLKITTKLVNTKEKRKEDRLKKMINFKRDIRQKFIKLFPLSDYEHSLYDDDIFTNTVEHLDKDHFFYSTGNIFMLDIYPKSKINAFITGMEKLLLENPSKNMFTRSFVGHDFRERIFRHQNSNNYLSRSNIGYCTPKNKKLNNILDYIQIEIFNFSNDYFGINFNLILSKEMLLEINNCIHATSGFDCESYYKYTYNKKKRIGRSSCSPELIKRALLREKIIEIKMRAYNFISKYIELSKIGKYSPISLDTYYSNIEDTNNRFLSAFDMDFTYYDNKHSGLTILHNEKDKQTYISHDFILDLTTSSRHINRSSNLMIIDKEDRHEEIYIDSNELTNICIFILYANLLRELNELISVERNLVEQNYNRTGILFNNIYSKINKNIFRYNLIFNEIAESHKGFAEPYLEKPFKNLDKYYKEVLDKHSIIEKASKDKISISNYNVSFCLSIISIIIAIIALFTSLFYDSSPNYNDGLKEIQQEQQSLYNQLTNIYNEEKKLNNTISNFINK